jgi:uncharacterized protein YfeS
MGLSRYDTTDAYTLEELRREYKASDCKGRIRLLLRLYKGDRVPPFEIALSAVEDPHVEIRQWIARHGKYLEYGDDEPSHPNLADRLKSDPDPFVRACLRENPTVFGGFVSTENWMEYFGEATHLERLALVRNPEVSQKLIETIFDCENSAIGVNIEERRELVLAFLTNEQALSRSQSIDVREAFDQAMGHETAAALDWVMTSGHFSKLWELISKWPKGAGNLQYTVTDT